MSPEEVVEKSLKFPAEILKDCIRLPGAFFYDSLLVSRPLVFPKSVVSWFLGVGLLGFEID